ncbi:pilin N-terminal domain-containing protein [Lacticaseibacillus hulanensis]|uniref:pilin N-terminal domain-containing protein n=1 Tax=Lacticaseibacillus hulanensis TaxID=2493111 RepID=UPI000FD77A64|nr:pilin N-terminal domain-containing protein [Lacticaseibacillus hulanensis]
MRRKIWAALLTIFALVSVRAGPVQAAATTQTLTVQLPAGESAVVAVFDVTDAFWTKSVLQHKVSLQDRQEVIAQTRPVSRPVQTRVAAQGQATFVLPTQKAGQRAVYLIQTRSDTEPIQPVVVVMPSVHEGGLAGEIAHVYPKSLPPLPDTGGAPPRGAGQRNATSKQGKLPQTGSAKLWWLTGLGVVVLGGYLMIKLHGFNKRKVV